MFIRPVVFESAHHHRIHRPKRRFPLLVEPYTRDDTIGRNQRILERRRRRLAKPHGMAPHRGIRQLAQYAKTLTKGTHASWFRARRVRESTKRTVSRAAFLKSVPRRSLKLDPVMSGNSIYVRNGSADSPAYMGSGRDSCADAGASESSFVSRHFRCRLDEPEAAACHRVSCRGESCSPGATRMSPPSIYG